MVSNHWVRETLLRAAKQVSFRSMWSTPSWFIPGAGVDLLPSVHLYALSCVPLRLMVVRKSQFAEIQLPTISPSQPPSEVGVC